MSALRTCLFTRGTLDQHLTNPTCHAAGLINGPLFGTLALIIFPSYSSKSDSSSYNIQSPCHASSNFDPQGSILKDFQSSSLLLKAQK